MFKPIVAAILAFFLAVWLIVWQIREIPGRTLPLVSTDLARKVLGKTMTSLTFTWTSAAGAHSLTTTQLPDEPLSLIHI